MIRLIKGDCLEELKFLQENSIDSIITDPPYGLGFMGEEWDKGIPGKAFWEEMLRVAKPGTILLAMGGTRTYHRLVCAIEDAGWIIRDTIMWVYGSGFPKSLNVGKSINKLETKEWSKISKALDNIDKESIIRVCKTNLKNVKIVETQSLKNQITAGQDMLKENFVVLNVVQTINQEKSNLLVSFVEKNLKGVQATNTKINTVLKSVEAEIKQLQKPAKSVEKLSRDQNLKSWNIFTAQGNVKEWLKENIMVNHKADEALKTLRGNQKYSNEEITSVLCVVLTDILKLTILNQSKTFQNLDTKLQTECVSATNVIITEYIAECLISNTVDILKGKAVDKKLENERKIIKRNPNDREKRENLLSNYGLQGGVGKGYITKGNSEWEGWGTSLKPAIEPICVAMKKLDGTFAENALKWGVAGLWIDGARVEWTSEADKGDPKRFHKTDGGDFLASNPANTVVGKNGGRWPANLIHDGSDEVLELMPETKSGKITKNHKRNSSKSWFTGDDIKETIGDSGSAARFFYCAKASRSERNMGLDEASNGHPTVKPIALMEYLCNLTSSPTRGTVLDPFMGSGTTALACIKTKRNFIGIELNEQYYNIAKERISNAIKGA